jgi:protein-L-isoaspartate(D-aspartate) O-methyltransferase
MIDPRFLLIPLLVIPACRAEGDGSRPGTASADPWEPQRKRMLREQIQARGIRDPKTLAALAKVPRHLFVPDAFRDHAYDDRPLPIGYEQTISQPYIVAFMTEALGLDGTERVLEVGTGSGYQAAILSEIAAQVHTIEIVPELADGAAALLERLGYRNVAVRAGDGYRGWPDAAPFDAIIVTAAPDHVPEPLVDQLAPGGRMIIPVGGTSQEIRILTRRADGSLEERRSIPVRFVPMTGEAERN